MKASHVLYKVSNLKQAVASFKSQGFEVDYGSKTNPHNALIYFSEGPYIELLNEAPLSSFSKLALRFLGQGKVVERLNQWKNAQEGFFGLCLETYKSDFSREKQILKKYNQNYFETKSSRTDPANRQLKWKMLFPHELGLPFMMTYFNQDPKPTNFIHPNGVKSISEVSFGTKKNLIPIVNELCDDDCLVITEGDGLTEVNYDQ